MTRFRMAWAPGLIVLSAGLAPAAPASGQDLPTSDLQQELRLLQGMRERGYYDLALEYLEDLRKRPDAPADLKEVIDYEEGRALLDEASRMGDLDRRAAQLDRARARLDAFAKDYPKNPLVPEAQVQVARLLFERGQTAEFQSKEAENDSRRQAKLAEARAAFDQARKAYDKAQAPLLATYNRLKGFIPEGSPDQILRDRSLAGLMDAMLQRGVVDYEEAQTYPPGSAERNALLDKAVVHFENLYKDYRTQLAGLYAQMWQAKCYEEKGTPSDLGKAMGLYNILTQHPAPELRDLQRKVKYFQIIVDGKRGENALAVDRADAWLREYPNYRMTEEGLGVQLELAKNILAQLETMPEGQRESAVRKATEILQPVVRVYSPSKAEAVDLLRKFRPRAAVNASAITGLTFENAYGEAEGAVQTHEWERAEALLEHAIRRADPSKKIDDVNKARQLLAYVFYASTRYYEAAVLGEHIARNYPKADKASNAAQIALESLRLAYGDNAGIDRASDLDHLLDLAKYTAETWSNDEIGDYARTLSAEIEMGRGNYADAWAAFEAIRPESSRHLDAKVKAGDAHWRQGLALREQGKTKEADEQAAKALDLLKSALKARQDAGAPPTDPGLVTNLKALAEIHRASDRPKEAIALLEPEAQALSSAEISAELAPLYEGLLTVLLKSHIAAGQSDKAIADMKALEKAGSAREKLTQLYLALSQSLQKEMEAQKARKDPAYARTEAAYRQFLSALAGSEAGQDYNSLMFAGESMLQLGMAKESAEIFRRVIRTYSKDKEFLQVTGSSDRLLRTDLKLAEALRREKKFADAHTHLDAVLKANPKLIEPMQEQGRLLEDWARAEPRRWNSAYNYWRNLARKLEPVRKLRLEYYDAIYHVAIALNGMGRKGEAAATLKSVMTLSPTVGNAEMKKRYQDFLATLGRS